MSERRSSHNTLPQLGELELGLLQLLWQHPDSSAKQLQRYLPLELSAGLSSVQSTLERLHKKGLVVRVKQRHAYRYSPSYSRSQLMGRLIGGVIQKLHDGPADTILSSFVSAAASLDAQSLDRLQELIDHHRQQEGQRDD